MGDAFVNPERIVYKSKGKTQDAHEAIRPTNVSRTPESIKDSLSKDQYRLYKLIWERFVASQMSPAVYDTLSVKLAAGDYTFRASGSRLRFAGFLEAYSKGEEEDEKVIPKLTHGDILQAEQLLPEQHFTQPPARYTDASLIKTLEEIGVGRPSTYAPTLTTIQARHYVTKEAKNLFPTELGEMVDEIMKTYFPDIVDIVSRRTWKSVWMTWKWARRNGSRLSVIFIPISKKAWRMRRRSWRKSKSRTRKPILSARKRQKYGYQIRSIR